jgi:release factor glutamine methyltransferase
MTEDHPLAAATERKSPKWRDLEKEAEQRAKESSNAVMPSLDHLQMSDFQKVYEPSDDTFLLLDGIQLAFQSSNDWKCKPYTVVELGCGTGVALLYVAQRLLEINPDIHAHTFLATDVNPDALCVMQSTAKYNLPDIMNVLHIYECDLASSESLLLPYENAVDIILFNPPYVPTPDEEVGQTNGIEASWAGGDRGRRVIDRAIPQIGQLLRNNTGVAYMITVDDNEPEQLAKECRRQYGLHMIPWVRRRARNEYLTVQKLTWLSDEE